MSHGIPTMKNVAFFLLAVIAAAVVLLAVRSFHKDDGVSIGACLVTSAGEAACSDGSYSAPAASSQCSGYAPGTQAYSECVAYN